MIKPYISARVSILLWLFWIAMVIREIKLHREQRNVKTRMRTFDGQFIEMDPGARLAVCSWFRQNQH